MLSPTEKRIQRKMVWKCLCVCGKECEVLSTNLTSGRTSSCGCMQYKIVSKHYREKEEKSEKIIDGTEVIDYSYRPDNRGYNECYVLAKCKFCGRLFWTKKTLLKKGGVKSCGCIKNSYGEKVIEKILIENNISFEKEKTFKDCYFSKIHNKCRFDFYIDNKYLIEFDGIQHYTANEKQHGWFDAKSVKRIKERDKYKNRWCQIKGIPLIRIPYYALESLSIDDLLLESTKYLI